MDDVDSAEKYTKEALLQNFSMAAVHFLLFKISLKRNDQTSGKHKAFLNEFHRFVYSKNGTY